MPTDTEVSQNVLLRRQGKVATIAINRADIKNALSFEDVRALAEIFATLANDDEVRAIILTGVDGTFCAGADLASLEGMDWRIEEIITLGIANLVQLIASVEKPVIAAVEGYAAGVGMSVALACDLMVMGESAKIFSPFVGIALIPDGGATQIIREKMGYQRAYEFFAESSKLGAQECLEFGLANRAVPDGDVQSSALDWAEELAEKAPIALSGLKRLMRKNLSLQETIAAEGEYQDRCLRSEDFREGSSAFFEKRKPVFVGK